jgi:hypothetical protein
MKKKNIVKTMAASAMMITGLLSINYVTSGSPSYLSSLWAEKKEPVVQETICEPSIDSLLEKIQEGAFVWDEITYPAYKDLIADTVFGGYSLSNTEFNKFHVLTKNGGAISSEIDSLGRYDFANLLGVKVGEVGSINDLFTNLQKHNELYARIAREEGVNRRLLLAIASQESRFNPYAISSANCVGLNQLHPSVYLDNNPFILEENVRQSAKLLRSHLHHYDGNDTLALAAYNRGRAGMNKVIQEANKEGIVHAKDILTYQQNGRFLVPKETREYPEKVLLYKELIRLYQPSHGEDRFLALYHSLEKARQERNNNS